MGMSSNATKLRKVSLYANEHRLPMGVKKWKHKCELLLLSECKMKKITLPWVISVHMQLYNRKIMLGKLSEIVCILSDPLIDSHSSCSWNDILCPAALYIQMLSTPECSFLATKNRFLVELKFCIWPAKHFFCNQILKSYDQLCSPSVRFIQL